MNNKDRLRQWPPMRPSSIHRRIQKPIVHTSGHCSMNNKDLLIQWPPVRPSGIHRRIQKPIVRTDDANVNAKNVGDHKFVYIRGKKPIVRNVEDPKYVHMQSIKVIV